ncbi:MAG: alpha/beta fold hydrolase [Anaerolineaceae bacterium]|nr:alpha/beta fold hydrolase [Anaerolineaceae bacterium]
MLVTILGWIFGLLFLGLAVFSMLAGRLVPGLIALLPVLLLLPPIRNYAHSLIGFTLPWWARSILVMASFFVYFYVLMIVASGFEGVYATPEIRTQHLQIYDQKMEQWPTAFEDVYVDTTYGKAHVIVSGPEDAPPMLLLNAAAMSGWSWLYNVGEFNTEYRTYAIDTIGEVGKSQLKDSLVYPPDGKAYADFHVEISDALGIEKAYVVGASFGGYMATAYTMHYPERVEKLALLGPMGMTPQTTMTALRIMFVQLYPFKSIQNSTVSWALGDDPYVLEETEDWFRVVLTSTIPRESRPPTSTPQELQGIEVPVLLVIGTRDALTGDPQRVIDLAESTPDIQIEVLDSGHLIGVEKAHRSNELIMEFFATD